MLVINSLKELAFDSQKPIYTLVKFLIDALKLTGYGLNLNGCIQCEREINGRTYFDYNNGGFYCEECFNGFGREINSFTLKQLIKIEKSEELEEEPVKPLKLIDFYLTNKAEENINSLKELLKII